MDLVIWPTHPYSEALSLIAPLRDHLVLQTHCIAWINLPNPSSQSPPSDGHPNWARRASAFSG